MAFALQWYGIPLAALFGLAGALFYIRTPDVLRPLFDDSYISLTFARNIIEHGKLSFDGQQWSTGATSPLHVLTMSFFMLLGFGHVTVSVMVGVIGHMLLAVGVYLLAWSIFRSRLAGVLGSFAISFTGFAALDAGNGLETPLFMALIAFSAATYFLSASPRARLITGVLVGLTILTRPEGAALMPAFVVYRWFDRPAGEPFRDYVMDVVRLVVPGVIALGMISLFSLLVSGSFGGTGGAKLSFFQEDAGTMQHKLTVAADQIGIFAAPLVSLIVLAGIVSGRRQAVLVALFWVPILLMYVYLFPGGLAHYFYRYQHPILPFLTAFAGGGAAFLIMRAMSRDLATKGLVLAALLLAVIPMYYQYDRWRGIYAQGVLEIYRDLEPMAIELNTIVQPGEVLATHDIGAVGYFAEYPVIDLVGLVNEEVVEYHEGRRLNEYVEQVRPDYLLIFPDWDVYFLRLGTLSNPERYELIKEYEGGPIRRQVYQLFRVHWDDP